MWGRAHAHSMCFAVFLTNVEGLGNAWILRLFALFKNSFNRNARESDRLVEVKAGVRRSLNTTTIWEHHPRSYHKGTTSMQTHPAVRVAITSKLHWKLQWKQNSFQMILAVIVKYKKYWVWNSSHFAEGLCSKLYVYWQATKKRVWRRWWRKISKDVGVV